jgi:hypothetical protein
MPLLTTGPVLALMGPRQMGMRPARARLKIQSFPLIRGGSGRGRWLGFAFLELATQIKQSESRQCAMSLPFQRLRSIAQSFLAGCKQVRVFDIPIIQLWRLHCRGGL